MSTTIKMLHDYVLVKPDDKRSSAGGIMLPESAKEEPTEGVVLEVGPGAFNQAGNRLPMSIEKDNRVLYNKWSGKKVKRDGEDLVVMRESEIVAIVK